MTAIRPKGTLRRRRGEAGQAVTEYILIVSLLTATAFYVFPELKDPWAGKVGYHIERQWAEGRAQLEALYQGDETGETGGGGGGGGGDTEASGSSTGSTGDGPSGSSNGTEPSGSSTGSTGDGPSGSSAGPSSGGGSGESGGGQSGSGGVSQRASGQSKDKRKSGGGHAMAPAVDDGMAIA